MDIEVLGAHNCESQNTKCASLLIDGVLALDAGGLTSSLSFTAQQKIKAVLLTHQHYDHVRDIPALAMNFALQKATINIYSTSAVRDALASHLLNGMLYPKFMERPQEDPTIKFTLLEAGKAKQIEGYNVLAVTVNHAVPTIGYQITSAEDKKVFYTGDTGPGLAECWAQVSPHMLFIDVTASNKYETFFKEAGHLSPNLLKQELVSFRQLKGYLPQVILVHMSPYFEKEIKSEASALAEELNSPITLAHEGMRLHL
ncbi:MAG: MBL fold metallo-hydrolase [Chloroflexi bacterium]|nr:MBL fold metallo-hydrolase [Chloroflexota bacterium]